LESSTKALRGWLVRYNAAVTFWMTLGFGLFFLLKGVRAL
jgi:hypothetical protein